MVRDQRGAADLRIVTVVTAIVAANEVRGGECRLEKNVGKGGGTRGGTRGVGGGSDLKVRYFRTRVRPAVQGSVFAGN